MWVGLALTAAILAAFRLLIVKHLLNDVKPMPLVVLAHLFSVIPFLVMLYFAGGVPSFNIEFLMLVAITGTLAAVAAYASYKAYAISQISLITSLTAFLPLLTLIWAWIFLGEVPTPMKFIGIITIVIGAYFLDIRDIRQGFLKPIQDLISDKGVRLFMVTVFAWSIMPIFEKPAIYQTTPNSPIFVGFMTLVISTFILLPFALRDKISLSPVKKHWFLLIVLGASLTLYTFTTLTAFTLTNVSYVVAITRLATLFVILIGAFFMHEKRLKERALGGTIMVIGAILVAI